MTYIPNFKKTNGYITNGTIATPSTIGHQYDLVYNDQSSSVYSHKPPSINDQIIFNKKMLKLLNKIKKIDSEAEEIFDFSSTLNYNFISPKLFKSEKIWNHKRIQAKLYSMTSGITLSNYGVGEMYYLDVFIELKQDNLSTKLFCCYRQLVLHILNNKCQISFLKEMDNLNKKLSDTVSKQVVDIIVENNYTITDTCQISDSLQKYLAFL